MAGKGAPTPSGTVTFLLSDVVGSTRLWAADADGMAASLRRHDAVFRAQAEEHGGYVFSTAGDSFAIAFGRATTAATCAEGIQRVLAAVDWEGGPELSVRLGLHLGEAEERDGDYFGPVVNLAARVMAAAHGGQCLATRAVADVLGFDLPDLGECHLRDIEAPVHLFQLGVGEFPPPARAGSGIVSLPSPRTSLVGREEDVATVRRLVAEHRLVTLTGVGGCGKTRIAIEVARREVPTFPQGVWFADLSTISGDDAIYSAIASTLDVVIPERAEAVASLTSYLAPRECLLVVDNCEHVIDEVADFIDGLLAQCPTLRIVATSRESLELDGERAWKVPSLSTDTGAAVELFVERAGAVAARALDDPAARGLIEDIVEHLDGVPLAIELAAARARSMDLDEIRDRLDDRFRLLSGGKRRSRQRQATLEATVQWSYDLLDEAEQTALQQLSVFQGGFDPSDAAAVLDLDDAVVVDLVDALVTKSLVDVTNDARGALRHRLLETIRLFGLSRLVASGTADAIRDRHLDHFANDRVMRTMSDWLALRSLARIDREYENFTAAAEWAVERDRPDAAAKIGACLSDAAPPRGDVESVLAWMALPSRLEGRDAIFVQALRGHALNIIGRPDQALDFLPGAIEAGEALGCDDAIFARLDLAVSLAMIDGDYSAQLDRYRDVLRQSREHFPASTITECAAMFSSITLAALGAYEEILVMADEGAGTRYDHGYAHIVEAWHAYALFQLGRIEDAEARVASFSPIPPSSQWAMMNLAVEYVVRAGADGHETALRSLAPVAAERVARRPALAADLCILFALIELRHGDGRLAARAIDLAASATGGLAIDLLLEQAGSASSDRTERERMTIAEAQRVPIAQRWSNNATIAPGLLAQAIARWS